MTVIKYKERFRKRTIEIKGHTGAGKIGEDLVCAGVSALLITLIAALETNDIKFSSQVKDGYGRVSSLSPDAKAAFNTVMCGYNALSLLYPEHITTTMG
ncbi:MAG: ribosomal-processing cysteine protease Prp [Oscillospiraceae bacterium]|nr:ribosomal-processing cysteine protease Prp [Oscillospiraceae bacterium]